MTYTQEDVVSAQKHLQKEMARVAFHMHSTQGFPAEVFLEEIQDRNMSYADAALFVINYAKEHKDFEVTPWKS